MIKDSNLIFWLPYVVFIIHSLEELPGFPRWASRYFNPITTNKFAFSHIPLILLVLLASYKASTIGYHGGWVVLVTACAWQFGVNALFHLATTVIFREYSPGMVTAATVSLPASIYFMMTVWNENRLTGMEMVQAIFWGTIIATAAIGVLFLHSRKGTDEQEQYHT
ncbi:MAG TPA: HXXEE domain-containing protein [Desulfosporosinus sp.]